MSKSNALAFKICFKGNHQFFANFERNQIKQNALEVLADCIA
jgi:hypothetical protein